MPRPTFPRSSQDFRTRFTTDADCVRYLAASRWPDGFRCARCGHGRAYALTVRRLWECVACGKQHSVTAGTVLHKTRTPLPLWFWAARLLATVTPGISALQLRRQLGLGSYQTAWTMCHKLRAGMVRPDREPLHGTVEVDETYVGGPTRGKTGRGALCKTLVIGAVEVRGRRAGRLRLRVIPSASGLNLRAFIHAEVAPRTIVRTDGFSAYNLVSRARYRVRPQIQRTAERSSVILPHIHRAFSSLKTWLLGTHHGVDPKHLSRYLDEFVFRYNRRGLPLAAFQTVLGTGGQFRGPTYKQLVHPELRG